MISVSKSSWINDLFYHRTVNFAAHIQNTHNSSFNQRNKIIFALICIWLLGVYRQLRSNVAWNDRISPDIPMVGVTSSSQHPIEILHAEAKATSSHMLESQSKTLPEAVTEYERRYKRPPPPGFEDWYRIAINSKATIIDNFDTMTASLEPFWGLSPQEIRIRARLAADTDDYISHIKIRDHKASYHHENGGHMESIKKWLKPIIKFIPDMDIPMAQSDEPRVVVPHDELELLKSNCRAPVNQTDQRRPFEFNELSNRDAWLISTLSCPPTSPARALFSPSMTSPTTLQFIHNATHAKSICDQPSYGTNHGFFLSPNSLKWSHALLPIFSRSTVSSFADILMPATDYTSSYRADNFIDPHELPWPEKTPTLYWRGASRDGHAHKGKWRQAQRFRFVKFANDAEQPITLLNETTLPSRRGNADPIPGPWKSYNATMSSVIANFNASFARQMFCEPEDCEAQTRDYPFVESEPATAAFDHRFVFDLDGHAFTERFYRLLASQSVVLKQTVFKEWHDDRLVPWLHYVPISMGMEELPEVIRFLASERGEEVAKAIADAGREWVGRAVGERDLELAWWRLLLEYARLIDDGRDDGDRGHGGC